MPANASLRVSIGKIDKKCKGKAYMKEVEKAMSPESQLKVNKKK